MATLRKQEFRRFIVYFDQ